MALVDGGVFSDELREFYHELDKEVFRRYHTLVLFIATSTALHYSMLSVSMLLDWTWWPGSRGAINDHLVQAKSYSLSVIFVLATAFVGSHWCTATSFQRIVTFVVLVAILLNTAPSVVRTFWYAGCESCTDRHEQLIAHNIAHSANSSVQTLSFVYPTKSPSEVRSRLHGLVLHPSFFVPGGQGPRFTEDVEEWVVSIVSRQLSNNWMVALVVMLMAGVSPLPPLSSIVICLIFTFCQLYPSLIELHWSATSGSGPGCCTLKKQMPVLVGPFLTVFVVIRLLLEYSLLKSFRLWHLNKEMLQREKGRLQYESSIARHNAERNKHIARAIVQMYKELSNQRSRLARPSSDNGSISISSSSNKLSSLIA